MNPYDKAKELELKAKRKREREAEENRRKFPILCDSFIHSFCYNFGGRVTYVENNQGEWKGRK